jgi:GxxExxY protein
MDTERNHVDPRYSQSALTDRIIGCFYSVYRGLGYGFLESVYERALLLELQMVGLKAEAQVPLTVLYAGHEVGEFRADVIVENRVLLELKAAKTIEPVFEAQLLNYLRCTEIEVGLLLNFGPEPQVRRFIYDNGRRRLSVSSVSVSG